MLRRCHFNDGARRAKNYYYKIKGFAVFGFRLHVCEFLVAAPIQVLYLQDGTRKNCRDAGDPLSHTTNWNMIRRQSVPVQYFFFLQSMLQPSSQWVVIYIYIYLLGSDQKGSKKDQIVRRPRNIDIQLCQQWKTTRKNKGKGTRKRQKNANRQEQTQLLPSFITQNAAPSLSKTPATAWTSSHRHT